MNKIEMLKKVAGINHKEFLKRGGCAMLSNVLNEQVYKDALQIAKNSEVENQVNTFVNSLNNLNDIFGDLQAEEIQTEKIANQTEQSASKTEQVDVKDKEVDLDELVWINGALSIQNKNAFEKMEYENYEKLNEKLTNDLNGMYVEVETLNTARMDALKNFDIAEVVKIDNKLAELQNMYKTKIKEVENHKKKIVDFEKEYSDKYKQLEESLKNVNLLDKDVKINKAHFGNRVLNDYKNNKIYDLVKNFLSNYSKQESKTILENSPELINRLGNNYKNLLKEFS